MILDKKNYVQPALKHLKAKYFAKLFSKLLKGNLDRQSTQKNWLKNILSMRGSHLSLLNIGQLNN